MPSFLTGFNKRKAIKIATAGIPASNLTAFPKLFMISGDTDIGGETTSQKLAVTLADGTTQVPYGALYFNVSGGSATLKIRAKFDLSSTWSNGDTIGYLYYDHTATDQSNKSGVFDANTKAYLPLEEDPTGSSPAMKDWLGNFNGTASGFSSSDSVAAQVGNGLNLTTATKTVVATGDPFNGLSSFTASAIISTNATGFNQPKVGTVASGDGWKIEGDGNSPYKFQFRKAVSFSSGIATADSAASAGTLYQVDGVVNGSTVTLYINGSAQASTGSLAGNIAGNHNLRIEDVSDRQFKCDEVILCSTNRSATWIAYRYTDHFSNSSTFTLGAEETNSSAVYAPYYYRHLAGSGALCV